MNLTATFLVPKIKTKETETRVLFLQEGSLKTLHLKTSPQGSWKFTREILNLFLTIVDTANRLELA